MSRWKILGRSGVRVVRFGAGAVLWLLAVEAGRAQPFIPGQTYFGRSNYTEYIAGDLPVIFSAPHGGELTPAEIPDRVDDGSDPDFTTVTDSYTEETALAVQAVFCSQFGHAPHIIICQLKRTKIDCNRSLAEGVYQTNVYATEAWNEFQNYISIGSNAAASQVGFGFYVDLHGQGHPIQRLELGYLLTADQLTNSDTVLNETGYAEQSSIRSLASVVGRKFGTSFSGILRGSNSFGGLMNNFGYPSVPDPVMPNPGTGTNPIVYPGDENPYFDGGYNTAVFSSQGGGPVDAVQIEANLTGVRDTAVNRTNYALAIAHTLDYFFTNYYGLDLRISAPCIWSPGTGSFATAANWGGILPVAGNYLLFTGPGGAINNNLASLSTGSGRIYSLIFGTNAGPYTLSGNAVSLNAGLTNYSSDNQIISNSLTLLGSQDFCSLGGGLIFGGGISSAGFNLGLNSPSNITFDASLSGSGGLTHSGPGTLTLNGASTYTGPTTNQSGTLVVNNISGCANGAGPMFISVGATLAGAGTIGGPVMISGTISPGASVGMLTVTNGLSFASGANYLWTLGANATNLAGSNFDQIVLSGGNLTFASNCALTVAFTNSASAPATNNSFWQTAHSWKIISLSGSAANPAMSGFAVIANNSFTAGKFSSSADSQGNVFMNYLPTPAPLIFPLLPGAGVTNAVISWSATAGVTYRLEYSTDLSSGIWTTLTTLSAAGSNVSVIDNSPPVPQRFYRVVIP